MASHVVGGPAWFPMDGVVGRMVLEDGRLVTERWDPETRSWVRPGPHPDSFIWEGLVVPPSLARELGIPEEDLASSSA